MIKRLRMRRGQSSIEYLFVVSLSLLLIIPASFLFLSYSSSSEEVVSAAQINRVGNDIVNTAQNLYVIGDRSYVTLEVSVPENVENVKLYGAIGAPSELVFTYVTSAGSSQAVFFSDVSLMTTDPNCWNDCDVDIAPGRNTIRIESRGVQVSIG